MKNIIKTLSISAFALATSQAFADTQIIDEKTYLVYNNASTNVNLDSALSEVYANGYAGLTGGELKYEFNATLKTFSILNATDDVTIKNTLNFSFTGDNWGGRSFVQFDIAAGKTLTLEDVYVSYTQTLNNSRLVFMGADANNRSNAALTFRNNSMASSSLVMKHVNVSYTNESLSTGIVMFWDSATLSMGGKLTSVQTFVSPTGAVDDVELKMNGHDYITNSYINNGGYLTPNLNVYFGDSASEDDFVDFVVKVNYDVNAKYTSSTITFHDFEYGETRYISKTKLPTNLSLIFKGYEGQEIICEQISGGEYNGYYSYYVIPEPSTYAMILGAIALGFVAYRRRK